MADLVASQTLLDGEREFIGKYTNISDGTGETAVTKISVASLNKSASGKACNGIKITKIYATTHGMEVRILWGATTDLFTWLVPQNSNYTMDFSCFGGLTNNAGAGVTGDVKFTTIDHALGDMYSIVIEGIKTYAP